MKRLFAVAILAGTLVGAVNVYAYSSPGAPTGYANDFAQVMSTGGSAALEVQLVQFAASTTNEISVVTIPSLGGDYIENYAAQLFKEWRIGTAKDDNGVLLLLAIEERKIRIEVGYGLEGALPDSVAAAIIAHMGAQLRAGDYDGAITGAVQSIMAATRGEYVAEQAMQYQFTVWDILVLLLILVVLLWLLIRFDILPAIIAAAASANSNRGGFSGSGSSGGSSFGGFSGGSSGGGGASGSW